MKAVDNLKSLNKEGDCMFRIGLFSRIDYLSTGFRKNLFREGREITEKVEKTDFDVLVGGLISGNCLNEIFKVETAGCNKEEKLILLAGIMERITEELADLIPTRRTNKTARLYIMVSRAYDGKYGVEIAEKLAMKRPDIRFWGNPQEHMPIKGCKAFQEMACLVPSKQNPFRIKYYSTPVDREVDDYFSIPNKQHAKIVVVGCFGSSYYQPKGGQSPAHIISLPNLHRIEENKFGAENQIGVTVIEGNDDGNLFVRRYNFNDLVLHERETIHISPNYKETEKMILEKFREKTWWTVGLLADKMPYLGREKITKILKKIVKTKRLQPPLQHDQASDRYFIPTKWIQRNLDYKRECSQNCVEERIISFGCFHALSVNTLHEYLTKEVPNLIFERGVTILIGAGDLIEGRKHGLADKKQVIAGATYTQQEHFSAWVIAECLLRVFEKRLHTAIGAKNGKTLDMGVSALVKEMLVRFIYISGNHDEWTTDFAVDALTMFRAELLRSVRVGITDVLSRAKLPIPADLDSIVQSKILRRTNSTLDSGVELYLEHLHMARANTTTLRSQSVLKISKANLCIHANFHVAVGVEKFEPEQGQRVAVQLGTLKSHSAFEDKKAKKVDFGVNFLRLGIKSGRIVASETAFLGEKALQKFSDFENDDIFLALARNYGIRESILSKS